MSSHERDFDSLPTDAELRAVERWADAIDAAVRGQLDADALHELEREAERDAWLREALADARAVRSRAAALPRFTAPASLDARIFAAIDESDVHAPSPRTRLRWMATASLAAAAALVLFFGPAPQPSSTYVAADGTVFTEDEVREAVREMEMAMGVLNGNLERTGSILRREMQTELREHVTEPVERGFGRTNDSIPFLRPAPQENEHSGTDIPPSGERPLRSHALPGAFHAERT